MTNDAGPGGGTRTRWLVAGILVAVGLASCAPTAPPPSGTPPDTATLNLLKGTVFGQQAFTESALIAAGQRQPVLDFTVEGTPPSIFVN